MDRKRRGANIVQLAMQKAEIGNKTPSRRLSFVDVTERTNINNSINETENEFLKSTIEPLSLDVDIPFEENAESVYTDLQPYIPTSLNSIEDLSGAGVESANLLNISTISEKLQQERDTKYRQAKEKRHYFDYLSDDETLIASVFGEDDADSDAWNAGSDTSTDSEKITTNNNSEKRENTSKEQISKPDKDNVVGEDGVKLKRKNKRKERKKLKQAGQEYKRENGVLVPSKNIQPNPCHGKKCGNDCTSITEDRRKLIFDHYWNLKPERRRDWIVASSQKIPIKRKRATESQKRNFTYKYFINEGEGRRSICLQFLASTINVSQKSIYYTLSNSAFGLAKEDLRGKCEPYNKTKESTKLTVINFIKSLPAVPSHYCRKDSSRVYLPQEYKNLSNLYKNYKKIYIEKGIDVVSERVFRAIFTDQFNIGFHIPKKDKCVKCLKFQSTEDNPELIKEKIEHEKEKNDTYSRFKVHQNVHKDQPSTLCVSFDLQKVLNTPHGESMLLYYSRKLAVYNLCFYESGTRNVYCFYWDEVNGKRGANEMATILNKYINIIDERGTIKHLLLYCDCCPGQNRNRIVMAMIHSTLQNCKNIETIQINFLLTGHTYMPVDSVHAVIEKNIKNCIVYAPSQWYTIFTTARQDPMPYNVELMTHSDFLKWDTISDKYFKGNLTGKISKIRVATFKKNEDSKMLLKYSMNETAESFSIDVQPKTKAIPACYKSLLPISKAKYDDLQKLCKNKVIPSVFHQEFFNIPTGTNIKDTLPETDIEDADSE